MVVIEKRADIGILRSMGFRQRDIRGIFLLEGFFIGILGVLSGVVLGLGLAFAQKYFKLVPLAEQESFLIDAYPIAIQPLDIVLVVSVAILLCMVAAIYPAHRASMLEPADAVRSMG
jgi:lipoprotein-releasing system permease protein